MNWTVDISIWEHSPDRWFWEVRDSSYPTTGAAIEQGEKSTRLAAWKKATKIAYRDFGPVS
jgi:hypothetical protein